tara:strand:+ start:214 stop:516 length:303 start_codon:yes stop_codon:yes gene_type:complete
MLSTSIRLQIQNILQRLANDEEVSLKERIYINKLADRDQSIASSLRKAKQAQRSKNSNDPIDDLINDLGIASADPHASFNADQEDLGEWFSGAPSWVSRS